MRRFRIDSVIRVIDKTAAILCCAYQCFFLFDRLQSVVVEWRKNIGRLEIRWLGVGVLPTITKQSLDFHNDK